MSNIVKAVSVVDETGQIKKSFGDEIDIAIPRMHVIKRQFFNYRENPYADQKLIMPDKQGYLDELNRVKVEIAQAKAELRSLGRQIEEAIEDKENEAGESGLPDYHEMVAEAESERLLAEAKENIAAMMAGYEEEGRRLAEESKNQGYLEGFDQGFAQAQNEFKSQNDPKMKELEDLLEQISNYREEMIAQNEKDLMDLVITVSEKVIGREMQSDPRSIVTMMYKILDENRREENIRITVSEDLMPAEAKVAADVRKLITQTAPNAMISVDSSAEEGTCLIETDKGITDLSTKTQLKNIYDMLRDS